MVQKWKKPPEHPIPAAKLQPLVLEPNAEVHGGVGGEVHQLVHGGRVKTVVVHVEAEKPTREVKAESSQVCLE